MAVSGGVDSVVLLDLAHSFGIDKNDMIVAHFDHGIRKESKRDAKFVEDLAGKYNVPFVLKEVKLGKSASEKLARKERYDFLRGISTDDEPKTIVTAHHQDDLVETIVMNILRGTGWRGLTPFWSDDIFRPMLNMTKADIIRYAIEHGLTWVEDETNYDSKYFRNRIRSSLSGVSQEQKDNLVKLYEKQKNIRKEIEDILHQVSTLVPDTNTVNSEIVKQEMFNNIDNNIGIEILNKMTNNRLTIPQLTRLLDFLKNAKSGDICQPGGGLQVSVYRNNISMTDLY